MALNPFKLYAQISALLKIKGAINNMKMSELSTSSGRLTLLYSLASIAAAVMGLLPAVLVAKMVGILVGIYMVYRTIAPALETYAKWTATPKDDAIVAELAAAVKVLTDKFGTPPAAAAEKGVDNIKVEQP